MAVSFTKSAAKQTDADEIIHAAAPVGVDSLLRAVLRDFFPWSLMPRNPVACLRYRSAAPNMHADIKGSGTETHATDSVWAGCRANRVAATNAAVAGPVRFETPFTILCALTLGFAVIGPFAAAATLRHGME